MTVNLRHYKKSIFKRFKGFAKFSRLIKKHNWKATVNKKGKTNSKLNLDLQAIPHKINGLRGNERGMHYARDKDLLHNGTFHEAIGPILVMAQCFCLMPVRGIRSRSAEGLSFCWCSFRTSYCLLYMLTTILDTLLTVNMIVHVKLDVRNIEPFIFHISIFMASIGFLRLAKHWPQLMRSWQEVEKQLPPYNSWQEKEELSTRIKTVTFVLITLSLTEHLLSTISAIHFANYCPAADDPIKSFFLSVVNQIFYVFPYSPWLAWLGKIQNILLTFGWTYMDVFVMIIGMGLSALYKRLQKHLERFQGLSMDESFWSKARSQYTLICDLVDEVDEAVSGIIMLSFANNLYFVCIQCLKSLNTMPSIAHMVYFYFSLMFLLARTLAVSLYLAEVNDRSRDPLKVFKDIPADNYCPEVERFVMEININKVAMTGMRYFDITRKLVLTVAGTIVTYELVLIQFHEDQKLWDCVNGKLTA